MIIEINELMDWLKTSVPGVIILGAIGSILALIILRILKSIFQYLLSLFRKYLPRLTKQILLLFLKILMKLSYMFGYEFGYRSAGDPRGEVAFFALQLSRAIWWLAIFTVSGIVTVSIFELPRTSFLTFGLYTSLVVTIVSLLWAAKHMIAITFAAHRLREIIKKSREAETEKKEDESEPKTESQRQET